MPLRIAVQMDPLDRVDVEADTSFALIEAAERRGHSVHEYQPGHLRFEDGRVLADARPARTTRGGEAPATFGPRETLDLGTDADIVLMRQDPPFDMSYITACHLLELLDGETLVLNDPAFVRGSPEKLFPLRFPELVPPTLIARDAAAIKRFREAHGDIIVKPLYGNGGAGVFRLKPGDANLDSLLEMFFEARREPVIAQAFLSAVAEGDRRVILIDGEGVGVINRRPEPGQDRSNMHVGGKAEPAELSEADRRICAAIGPELKRRGQVLVGIDVIGDRLTEVNVTSPTGLQELKRFSGVDAAELFWEAAERRFGAAAGG